MSYHEPFEDKLVALSISESPDMEMFGLSSEHLQDAMTEVARHLLALGARLAYGGDLRPGGFSELLFELVARHRPDLNDDADSIGIVNYLAWPVHISMNFSDIEKMKEDLQGIADIVCLDIDGQPMSFATRAHETTRDATVDEWSHGLTRMRSEMSRNCNARVLLGGRVTGFLGAKPGLAEEASTSMSARVPTYLMGGFGGCTRDIAESMGLVPPWAGSRGDWTGRSEFGGLDVSSLRNGLLVEENTILARTPHIDQASILLMRGMSRLWS